jgi:hypothetical protein
MLYHQSSYIMSGMLQLAESRVDQSAVRSALGTRFVILSPSRGCIWDPSGPSECTGVSCRGKRPEGKAGCLLPSNVEVRKKHSLVQSVAL